MAPAAKYHRRDGAEAMRALLALPEPPDAVFCFNDLLAVGALRAAAEHGRRVPDDLAVVGFDGSEEGAYTVPTLTTIDPDKAAIAERAVERIAERIAGGPDATADVVGRAPPLLIERQPARWNGDRPQQARANGDHQRPASEGPPRRPALSMAGEGNNHFYQGVFHSVEVEMLMARRVTCIECGDALPEERAELGYDYCTNAECQAVRHRGLTITTVGVNKSADAVIVADPDDVRRRGEAGEFAKKDTALGLDYRRGVAAGARRTAPRPPAPARSPAGGRWTAEQEKLVRLYHDMGLSPRRIVERARQNAPRLGITERLAVQILSSPPRR